MRCRPDVLQPSMKRFTILLSSNITLSTWRYGCECVGGCEGGGVGEDVWEGGGRIQLCKYTD